MSIGYCTVEDVRRAMQEAEFSTGLSGGDYQAVVDAITGVSDSVEKATKRHWFVTDPIEEDDQGLVQTGPETRDDEHDIPTHGGFVHGSSEIRRHRYRENSDALLEAGPRHDRRRRHDRRPKREIRLAFGDVYDPYLSDEDVPAYTRITFDRKDVQAVNTLNVVGEDGAFEDWTDGDYTGGVGNTHRGEDWWVRVNNGGVSELYIDVKALDDDLHSFSKPVYVDIDYGHEGLPPNVRRGVALLSAAELVLDDDAQIGIPDSGQLVNLETKAQKWERNGIAKLETFIEDEDFLERYT